MIPNIVKGKGITGAVAYSLGQGNEADGKTRKTLAAGDKSRAEILGGRDVVKVGIEAAVRFGWDSIIGQDGIFVGMKGFGDSGPAPDLYKHFNITAEAVTEAVSSRLQR